MTKGKPMFQKIKTIRLDDFGREVAEWHDATENVGIAEIVAAVSAQYPHSLIEARYVR